MTDSEFDPDIIELRSIGAERNGQMVQTDSTAAKTDFLHVIHISKFAGRALSDDVLTKFVDQMISAVNTSARLQRGWKLSLRTVMEGDTKWYRTEFLTQSMTGDRKYHIFFELIGKNPKADPQRELNDACVALEAKGASFGGKPFVIETVDGEKWEQSAESRKAGARGEVGSQIVGYAPFHLPENYLQYFSHLFGLDSHIRRVAKTIQLAERTDFRKRVNTVLQGPPGCGKTEICRAFKMAVGDESVYEIDATAATKAGILEDLDNFAEMPRIIIIEEIEKAQGETLSFLLGIMDTRGEIRKTTARTKIHRDMKCLVIATVNNWKRFSELNYGALSSRFSNTIHFTRPDEDLLTEILKREIDDLEGNGNKGSGKKAYGWIKPTLNWIKEVDNWDPRYVIAVCLTGGPDLLTDEYQTDLRATMFHEYEEVVFDAES